MTIEDIRDQVVEQRSILKRTQESPRSKLKLNRTQMPLDQHLIPIDSRTPGKDVHDFYRTVSLFSPSKLRHDSDAKRNETARRQTSKRSKEKEKPPTTNKRSSTPTGCKGVQIDSSLDQSEAIDDSLYKQLDLGQLEVTSQGEGFEKKADIADTKDDPPHQIQLSTHLFNGEYLVQSINEQKPSAKEVSHGSSRFIVPQQILQEPQPSSLHLRHSKVRSKASKVSRSPPAPLEPHVHH